MARVPKLFFTISSANLSPSDPVFYRLHVTTHHWRGKLLEDTWAKAEMEYCNIYKTEEAVSYIAEKFLEYQILHEPSQDIEFEFPENEESLIALSLEDKEYFDVVKQVTDQGWAWDTDFQIDITTGDREIRNHRIFEMSLSTWEWNGLKFGGSVKFSHRRRDGENKAALLLRILETAEKIKKDFPESIPRRNLKGEFVTDKFLTSISFISKK